MFVFSPFLNQLTSIYTLWYGHYVTGGHSNLVIFSFLWLVITALVKGGSMLSISNKFLGLIFVSRCIFVELHAGTHSCAYIIANVSSL